MYGELFFTDDEIALLRLLLVRELDASRIESHYTENHDYRDMIRTRIDRCHELLRKIESATPDPHPLTRSRHTRVRGRHGAAPS